MKEEWKIIKINRNAIWEISNYGNMKRNNLPYYPEIEFDKNKKPGRQRCSLGRIHRLVWEAFIGPIPKGLEIDHIDTNGCNNRLDNLRLVTHTENMNNPLSIKHSSDAKKGKNHPMYGKKQSEATKRKRSLSLLGNTNGRGNLGKKHSKKQK